MVPKLRFKEFTANWKDQVLKDVCSVIMDGTHFSPKSKDGPKKYITSKNIRNEGMLLDDVAYISEEEHRAIYKKCPVQHGDVLLTKDGANTGNCCLNSLKEEFSLLSSVAVIRGKENSLKNSYLLQVLQSKRGQSKINDHIAGQAITRITLKKINEFAFSIPALDEQTKISDFLSSVDEKTALLNKQYSLLCQYKKGMMQKIFSQKIRFKSNDGSDFLDWRTVQLSECLYEHKKRNKKLIYSKEQVLSVSGDVGIVNQIKLLGRSYAGESVENYHIVHQGDIVYTKSPLKENPFGIIKSNKGNSGIVSTLYAVYSCLDCIDHNYIDYYFSRKEVVNNYLKPLVNKGAKNDMKVNNQHVLTGDIVLPCREEQEKIVSLLSMLDDKIAVKKAELDKLRTWKQGLLQQMFV